MKRIILLFAFAMLASSTFAWEPQPWRKYLIDLEVKQDTMPQPSIMLHEIMQGNERKINPYAIPRCAFYVYQPGIFEAEDERCDWEKAARGEYTTSDFLIDVVTDALVDLFSK